MSQYYFKDKRVDRLAQKRGYTPGDIFYSPISLWLSYYLLILFTASTTVGLFFIDYWVECAIFLLGAYLAAAYLNNSFIVTFDQLIVVNTNFPFRRTKVYNISEIEDIHISKEGLVPGLLFAFFIGSGNYVQVNTLHKSKRFYCICLDIDCYDENNTEKTLDDFHFKLRVKGIRVHFELD